MSRIEPGENELIAFAAAAGTEADDGTGRHSPFTAALLKHIEMPGLEIRLLFGGVRDDVLAATRRRRTPHVYGTLGRLPIYLKAPPVDAKAPAVPPQPRAAALEGNAEVDGCFGGHVRPANLKEDRVDRRLAKHQTGKRKVVVVLRERGGETLPGVFNSEGHALSWLRNRVAKGHRPACRRSAVLERSTRPL